MTSSIPRNRSSAGITGAAAAYARRWRIRDLLLAGIVLGAAIHGNAASDPDEEFGAKDKPWTEIEIQLPSPPEPANLLTFYVGPLATQTFAIDAKSLTVGEDGVVRYTLITTSRAGARNISYEGIRCQSMEKKLYAFGRDDGTWSRSRKDQWEPISNLIANRHHGALANDYFCQNGSVAGKATAIIDRLRSDRRLSAQRG